MGLGRGLRTVVSVEKDMYKLFHSRILDVEFGGRCFGKQGNGSVQGKGGRGGGQKIKGKHEPKIIQTRMAHSLRPQESHLMLLC